MPYFYTEAEVEISVDDFLESCSLSEIADLIKTLKEDGHLDAVIGGFDGISVMQGMHNEALVKLQNAYYQLSNEDIQTIENIAKKY